MKAPRARLQRPRVALLIETSRAYGRDLLVGVAQYVRVHGPWSIEFQEGDPCEQLPEWFAAWKGDGVLARVKTLAVARALMKLRIPVVDLYGGLPELKLPTVRSDETAVGRMAAEHLLERGFRQFAFCGFNGTDWSDRRRDGFEGKVAQAGFSCQAFANPRRPERVPSAEYEEHGPTSEQQLNRWLEGLPKPIGLMACNDVRARQVLNSCRNLKLAVPDDVAVIGVDKDEVLCELSDLPISSVILNTQRIGFEAAALLEGMMGGGQPPGEALLVPPRSVATRHSTDVLAVDDRQLAAALRFIREHACERIDVPMLLKAVPLSRSSLERRFAQFLGRSPKAEILRVQLERAKQLLMDSDLPLAMIAEKAGFDHPEHMSRLFKKKTGTTPGQFRAQSQPQH